MPLEPEQIIHQRYRVIQRIGQGGFGSVYQVWDTALSQPCAMKENLDTSPEAQRQFQREAILLAGLRHPNLPRVTDHFFIPDQGQYLVMDFVEGQNLAALLAEHGAPFPLEDVLHWVEQVCHALEYLHGQNPPIIHRDIKPQNIILTPQGQVMLVDFGISKVYDPNASTTRGAKGVTPGYAPPEQYGMARTDQRSDVYALAATLYYLLTNQLPPDGLERLVHGLTLTPPCELNPEIPAPISQAIVKGLEPESQKRHQSVTDFRNTLYLHKDSPDKLPTPQTAPTTLPTNHVSSASDKLPAQKVAIGIQPAPRPKGVIWVAVLCILTGLLGFLGLYLTGEGSKQSAIIVCLPEGVLGVLAGYLLLRGKELGRRLALAYLGSFSVILALSIVIGNGR